ncbi:MAG: hypothetical protein ACJ79S_12625 [Gemmatimonadaceae bacterium]
MARTIRLFMLVEAAGFLAAALVHSGMLVAGYEHQRARVAEATIATVLLAGLVLSQLRPEWTRKLGSATQAFALLGTLVGLFTMAIGIGPRTTPDLEYHAVMVVVLVSGLGVTARESNGSFVRVSPRIWLPVAGVLTLVNVFGVWVAAHDAEPRHATVHAVLGVLCALWTGRLLRAKRLRARQARVAAG